VIEIPLIVLLYYEFRYGIILVLRKFINLFK
jgi:hypothetical protein